MDFVLLFLAVVLMFLHLAGTCYLIKDAIEDRLNRLTLLALATDQILIVILAVAYILSL